MMSRNLIWCLLLIGLTETAFAQINPRNVIRDTRKEAEKVISGEKSLSNDEVISGLKEALSVGTNKAVESASVVDGFYKNPHIFIPFPEEAAQVKRQAERLGMQRQVDEFVTTLNRAAEEAAKEAAPIFLDAIRQMSISDGMTILNGEDDAATTFLERNTYSSLYRLFLPVVKEAVEKVDVTRHWNPIITAYNRVPGVQRQNPDLDKYVTEKAIEGLFFLIAEEEKKIRNDPAARVTDILRKVFG